MHIVVTLDTQNQHIAPKIMHIIVTCLLNSSERSDRTPANTGRRRKGEVSVIDENTPVTVTGHPKEEVLRV